MSSLDGTKDHLLIDLDLIPSNDGGGYLLFLHVQGDAHHIGVEGHTHRCLQKLLDLLQISKIANPSF